MTAASLPASGSLRPYLQIHLCVLLWGFTAILGKAISLSAFALVWWRMLLVAAVLACVPSVWRALRRLGLRLIAAYAGIGVLVALHWLTFYASIKLSNASVGATCMALAPVFLSVVEPALARRRPQLTDVLLGVAMVPGVALVVGGVPAGMHLGIAVGALSALFVACFGALNKHLVDHGTPLTITAIELAAGAAALSLLAPLIEAWLPGHSGPLYVWPDLRDGLLLLVLAGACTLFPFALSLVALRHLTAFSAQLAVNLEPIYAIVLAAILFGEHLELGVSFYAGVAIVMGAVFAHPWLHARRQRARHMEMAATAESHTLDG